MTRSTRSPIFCLCGALLCALALFGCDADRLPPGAGEAGAPDAGAGDLALDGTEVRRDGEPPDAASPDATPPDLLMRPDAPPPGTLFRMAMFPDTQYFSATSGNISHFEAMTTWVISHYQSDKLAFVSHVGDIVNAGAIRATEWKRADKAMKILDGDLLKKPDGLIPYSAVAGNHDYDLVYVKGAASQYIKYFGPDRYKGRSWFLGASSDKMNMAQIFSVGGLKYLHFGLEWVPSDSAILWAQGIIAKYPNLPVIIATHHYLEKGDPAKRATKHDDSNGGGNNSGENLYRKLVEPYPQVFLVICGHIHGDGRRLSKSALGHSTMEVLADYQNDPNGGNGWMQIITFDPANKSVAFKAFSPTYVPGSTKGTDRTKNKASNPSFSFDLDGHRAMLATQRILHLRQGQDQGAGVYKGTVDTYIGNGKQGDTRADQAYGDKDDVWIDGDSDSEQGLLRFDNLVGSGPGQIPPQTKIRRAVLTVTTEGSYADSDSGAKFYRMTAPWDEKSTHDSLKGGVSVGTQSEAKADLDLGKAFSGKGTRSFDVTASVQAWVDGKQNHGWVIVNNGTDRWQFRSSEWGTVAERPMLSVVY